MFQRKHHIAFAVIVIIAVATMIIYSLTDNEAFGPGNKGQQETAAP